MSDLLSMSIDDFKNNLALKAVNDFFKSEQGQVYINCNNNNVDIKKIIDDEQQSMITYKQSVINTNNNRDIDSKNADEKFAYVLHCFYNDKKNINNDIYIYCNNRGIDLKNISDEEYAYVLHCFYNDIKK